MATLMDLSLLGHVRIVFIFILVFGIVYAILSRVKMFGSGNNQGINAIIALAVAFLVVISSSVVKLVSFMTPWFIIIVLIAFFIIFGYRMFNVGEDVIAGALRKHYIWIIIPCILLVVFGFANVYGQSLLEEGGGSANDATGDGNGETVDTGNGGSGESSSTGSTASGNYQSNFVTTFFHPKILAFFFLFLIGLFTILFLTGRG